MIEQYQGFGSMVKESLDHIRLASEQRMVIKRLGSALDCIQMRGECPRRTRCRELLDRHSAFGQRAAKPACLRAVIWSA